ncbi:unnamed protein product [Cunninghamella blakesleeana]
MSTIIEETIQMETNYWETTSSTMVDKIIDNDYQLLEEIGRGSYGCLFLGQSLKTNDYVAIKVLSKTGLNHQQLQLQQLEIDIQESLKHPYLLGLHRVIHEKDYIYMVMELCDQGDLFDYVIQDQENNNQYDESIIKSTFLQILEGIEYMHSQGVYHRDIKLENVLLQSVNEDDDQSFVCKVADFGLATRERYSLEFGCGSTTYLAPEHFDDDNNFLDDNRGSSNELNPYDAAASDVWSIGILLLAFLFGRNPWQESTGMDPSFAEYRRHPSMLKDQLFPNLSSPCAKFLQSVLSVNAADRPTISQVKKQFLQLDKLLIIQDDNNNNESDSDINKMDDHKMEENEDDEWCLDQDDYVQLPVDIPILPKPSSKASFDSAIFSAPSGMSWSDMVEEDFQRNTSDGYSSLSSSIIEEEDEGDFDPHDDDDTDMFVHSEEKGSWWL